MRKRFYLAIAVLLAMLPVPGACALTSVSVGVSQTVGAPVTFVANAVDGAGVQYRFLSGSTVIRDFAASNICTYSFSTVGMRTITAIAKDAFGKTVTSRMACNIVALLKSVSLSASPVSPQMIGTPIKLTAATVGGLGIQYKFMAGSYVLRDYSYTNWMSYSFRGAATHSLTVHAKDPAGKVVVSPVLAFTTTQQLTSVSLSVNQTSPQPVGSSVKLTANAVGGSGVQYKFLVGTYVLRNFAPGNTCDVTFSVAGNRQLTVVAREASGRTVTSPVLDFVIWTPTVDALHAGPSKLTLFAGTTYTCARAHALDADGKVISKNTPIQWSSQNSAVASVTETGLTPDGRCCGAKIAALKAGVTTVKVTGGGKTATIDVTVINNPNTTAGRFMEIPLDKTPGLSNVLVSKDGYRYAYFYGQPGVETHLSATAVTGKSEVVISTDQTFEDESQVLDYATRDAGQTYSGDFICSRTYGVYYVRIKGLYGANSMSISRVTGSSCCVHAEHNEWTTLQPNGQYTYDTLGASDYQRYRFPVKPATVYWVEVYCSKGRLDSMLADNAEFGSPMESDFVMSSDRVVWRVDGPAQEGYHYLLVAGDYRSNAYRIRIYTADPNVGGYQVHGSPKILTMPAGTSRTIFADSISPAAAIVTPSTTFSWLSENPGLLTVTPGATSGDFATATITAGKPTAAVVDTSINVTANGVEDRVSVRVVDLNQLHPDVHEIRVSALPQSNKVLTGGSALYWFQVVPGKEYRVDTVYSTGYPTYRVFTDPTLMNSVSYDYSYWSSEGYQFIADSTNGTMFLLVSARYSTSEFAIAVNEVKPASASEKYYPRGAQIPVTVNGQPISARIGDELLPDVFTFVTSEAGAEYTVKMNSDKGNTLFAVCEDPLRLSPLHFENLTEGTGGKYTFISDTVGKKYYILVNGEGAANHYRLSVTKP